MNPLVPDAFDLFVILASTAGSIIGGAVVLGVIWLLFAPHSWTDRLLIVGTGPVRQPNATVEGVRERQAYSPVHKFPADRSRRGRLAWPV